MHQTAQTPRNKPTAQVLYVLIFCVTIRKKQAPTRKFARLCAFSFPFHSVLLACCYRSDTRAQKYESDEGSGLDDDDEVIAIINANNAASIDNTLVNTNTTSTQPIIKTGTTASILAVEPNAAMATDRFASTLSSIEQSADAMSPLCVSPMDLDSETDVASSSQATHD